MVRALESDEYTVEVDAEESEYSDFENESIDYNEEIRYNRKQAYKTISKQEYAIISSRIMGDNAGNIASDTPLPRYNTVRSANYFYVYENFAPGEFGVLKQISLTDNNRNYIQSIEAKIGENNGESTITSTSELNRVLQVLKNQARNNHRNNVNDFNGRADSSNGRFSLSQSEGNGKRNPRKGDGNSEVNNAKKRVTLAEAAIDSVMKKGYNISRAEIEKILDKKSLGLELSREEKRKLGLYESEKTAHSTEILLGNEQFIEKIMQSDASLAKKLFIRITNLAKSLGNSDGKAAREELKRLKHAQELYLKAAEKVGNAEFKRIMQLLDDEEEAEGENIKASFKGYNQDGRGMYESNFPKGTPKKAKAGKILGYIQNVWSKKPIKLNITDSDGNIVRNIEAQFDPYYTEEEGIRTDASKLMGGNRHGTAAEKRVTLDLADDYYKIASEAVYNYSKKETGKDSATHEGVKEWHYFVNDIYFAEKESENYEPYTVTINVKEKDNGSFVYSFSAEKSKESITRQTLHADVTKGNPLSNDGLSIDSITEKAENVNTNEKKTSVKYSLKESEDAESLFDDKDLVIRTKGQHAAFMAEYHGEKVFTKKLVSDELLKIEEIKNLPAKVRDKLINDVWAGYNNRLHADGYELYSEIMMKDIPKLVDSHNDVKMAEVELDSLDSRLAETLSRIVEGARPAKWAQTVGEAV